MFLKMLLLLLLPLLASGERKKFRCNSPEDVREMEIDQIYQVDNHTFLLKGNQMISFKAPFCFLNFQKEINCAASQPFEMESNFKSKSGRLKGFFYYPNFQTYAIYKNKELEAYMITMGPSMDLDIDNKNLIEDIKNRASMFEDPNFTLLYKYESGMYFAISYQLNSPNRLNIKLVDKGDEYSSTKKLDFNLSNLMAYEGYSPGEYLSSKNKNAGSLGNHTLLMFQQESSKLYVSFFETKKSPNEIQMHTRPIDFAELFNCVRKLEKEEDLKGIFFSGATSPRWYIYIHRFYLEIKEDLLATGFVISDEHYRGTKEINFPGDVFFNLGLKKFVKEVGSNAYFVVLDRIFKLDLPDENLLEMPANKPDHLTECEHSTVDQKGDLYCFAPDQLFICSSGAKPIGYANLFSGTGVRFDADDRVQVAFSHSESIILMTRTSYYTFSKDSLQLKGSQITLKSSSDKPVTKDTHYLFGKSSEIGLTGTSITLLFWLIMTFLLLGILILVAYLRANDIRFVLQRRNRSNKPSHEKFEKRNPGRKEKEKSRKSP